jgi:hypothetical protein
MRAHHGERGDVPVLDAVGGLFFHFCQDVADDFGRVVRRLLRARDLITILMGYQVGFGRVYGKGGCRGVYVYGSRVVSFFVVEQCLSLRSSNLASIESIP